MYIEISMENIYIDVGEYIYIDVGEYIYWCWRIYVLMVNMVVESK